MLSIECSINSSASVTAVAVQDGMRMDEGGGYCSVITVLLFISKI